MKKVMYSISVTTVLLTVLAFFLYCYTEISVLKAAAITFGTTAYHFLMRLAVGYVFDKIMKNRADYSHRWYKCSRLESKIYELIRVKHWKGRVPSYNPDYFDPKRHSWEEILEASCQAELVHETIILFSFVPILFSYWFGQPIVFISTSVCAAMIDLIFVILQRYNRPRIIRLIKK